MTSRTRWRPSRSPLPALGVCVGLGTGGCAGNNDLNLFPAMNLTVTLHQVVGRDPTILPAEDVLHISARLLPWRAT